MYQNTKILETELGFSEVRIKEEIHFKYIVLDPPAQLAKMFKTMPNKCWKYNQKTGTYYHIWWTCVKAKNKFGKNT